MALELANIKDWPDERIPAAAPSIAACLRQLVDDFPEMLTVDWLLAEVHAGRQEMWLAFDGAEPDVVVMTAFTQIMHYPATGWTYCRIVGLAGDRLADAWPLLDEFEEWARRNGAQEIMAEGREGWARILKGRGYTRRSTTLAKRLA